MQRWALRVMVALSLLASALHAQESAAAVRHLTFALGPALLAQRDLNASPLRYTGTGALLQAEYSTRTDRRWLTVRTGWAVGTLRSALTQENGLPRQETGRGWVELEYARGSASTDRRTRFYVGGLLAAHGAGILHRYAAPGNDGRYAVYRLSLGPLVAVERSMGGRKTLRAILSVPALTIIGRPYGSVHAPVLFVPSNVPLQLQLVTVPTFLAADFTAAYSAHVADWGALVIGHHLAVEHYRGAQALRIASQGVSIAIAVRMKGAP